MEDCINCDATGLVFLIDEDSITRENDYMPCPKCEGSGKVEDPRTPKVPVYKLIIRCPICGNLMNDEKEVTDAKL